MVNLREKSLKLMSGQDFANTAQTDGQTDDMRNNIIRPKGVRFFISSVVNTSKTMFYRQIE